GEPIVTFPPRPGTNSPRNHVSTFRGTSASTRTLARLPVQPKPKRAKILRQEHVALRRKGPDVSPPIRLQQCLVRARLQRDPVRALPAMRAAHAFARPREFLPATRAVARHRAKRIAAHRELGIKTRLHQLAHRIGE